MAFVFVERDGVVIDDLVELSIRRTGIHDGGFATTHPEPIPSGSRVTSVFVHVDKVGGDLGAVAIEATLKFHQPIIGITTGPSLTWASSGMLGAPGTSYNQSSGGLDDDTDILTISEDSKSVQIRFSSDTSSDQMRVVLESP